MNNKGNAGASHHGMLQAHQNTGKVQAKVLLSCCNRHSLLIKQDAASERMPVAAQAVRAARAKGVRADQEVGLEQRTAYLVRLGYCSHAHPFTPFAFPGTVCDIQQPSVLLKIRWGIQYKGITAGVAQLQLGFVSFS